MISAKPVGIMSKNLTKAEKTARLNAEKKFKLENDTLSAPEYLTDNQKQIFNYIKSNLAESDLLTNVDLFVLAQTSITIDRIREAEEDINIRGQIVGGKVNVSVKIKDSYTKDLFRLMSELCLSPQSRAKISLANAKANEKREDPLLKVLGI